MLKLKNKVPGLGLILSLAATLAPAQDYPCDVYLRSAKIYLFRSNPDYESALKNLEAGYKKCYDDPLLHELLGRIYADRNQIDKMVEEFKIAIEKGHSKPEEFKKVLESKWGQEFQAGSKVLDQLELKLQEMAILDTIQSEVSRKALQEKLSGEMGILRAEAIRRFSNCIVIDSPRYEPYINAASQYIQMDQLDKADTLLAKAYQIAPESLSVIQSYGVNLYNLQKYDRAIEMFEKAVKIDPNDKESLMNLASLYGQKGDMANSMRIWNLLIEKGMADKDVYFNRGSMYLTEAEKLRIEARNVEDSLAKHPKDAALKERKDQILKSKMEALTKAESDFSKSLELDSADVEARYQLGVVQMLKEDLDKAMQNLEKVTSADGEHKSAWANLAIIYTLKGMKEKAKEADVKSRN